MSNKPNQSSESKNKEAEDKKQLEKQFIEKFIEKGMSKNDRSQFITDVYHASNPKDIKQRFDDFFHHNDHLDFSDVEDDLYERKSILTQIQTRIVPFNIAANRKKDEVYKSFLKEYDISNDMITDSDGNTTSFKNRIYQLDMNTIDEFKSQKKRAEFIRQEIPDLHFQDKLGTFLDGIISKERYDALSLDDKKELKSIIANQQARGYLTQEDYEGILFSGILNEYEMKDFIHLHIPTISFKDAVELRLITKSQRNKIYSDIISDLPDSIPQDIRDNYISDLKAGKCDYFDISTSYFRSLEDLKKVVKKVTFKQSELDGKEHVEEDKKQGPKNLKEFISSIQSEFAPKGVKNLLENPLGTVLIFERKKNDVTTREFFEIHSSDFDNSNTISLSFKGEGNSIHERSPKASYTYFQILETLKEDSERGWGKAEKLQFFSRREFDEYKKDDTNAIQQKISDFQRVNTFDELELSDIEYAKSIGSQRISADIEELEKELNDISESHVHEREMKEKLIQNKKDTLSDLQNTQDEDKLLGLVNLGKFLETLDVYDPQGSQLGLSKDVAIFIDSPDKNTTRNGLFFIDSIDSESGDVWMKGQGRITFEEFCSAFKTSKAKRVPRIYSFDALLEKQINGDNADLWKDHELKDGQLVAKNRSEPGGPKEDKSVEYLVSNDSNDIIRIDSIAGDQVTIQFGERKDYSDLDEKKQKKYKGKDGKVGKGEELYIGGAAKYTMSMNELHSYISSGKFHPSWETGKSIALDAPEDMQNDIKGTFASRFFNRTSIAEIFAGGKMFLDSVQETLKKGGDIHAAKFASWVGGIIPIDELQSDLQIKLERELAEQMDKEIEGLGKVDSPIATERIKKWLLNKDTPEYKKEAGLMFMLEQYGHLCTKKMSEDAGQFLWYEAFGGKIGDSLYMEEKRNAAESNVGFSEETLMLMLLKKQCKGGYNGISRRTRLHKEFEGKWGGGIKEEFEKGYGDADKKRNASDMVKGAKDEMYGGTINNAIGWMKKAIERGGSIEDMSEPFFMLMFSGAANDLDQKTTNLAKGLWDEKMPMSMARFMGHNSDVTMFNKVVVDLSERIDDIYGYGGSMAKDAKRIFKLSQNRSGVSQKERLKEAENFWKKYSTPLVRALNISNKPQDQYSSTDKLILLESNKNTNFKSYRQKLQGFGVEPNFKADFMEDAFLNHGVTSINEREVAKQYFICQNGASFRAVDNKNISSIIWKDLTADIRDIKKVAHAGAELGTEQNLQYQKQILLDKFRGVFAGILDANGNSIDYLKSFNAPTNVIGQDLNKWKINIKDQLAGYSPDDIANGKADNEFQDAIEHLLSNDHYDNADDVLDVTRSSFDGII